MLGLLAADAGQGCRQSLHQDRPVPEKEERDQDAQGQFHQPAAQGQPHFQKPRAYRLDQALSLARQLLAVRGQAPPVLGCGWAHHRNPAQPIRRRGRAGLQPVTGRGGQFLDVVRQRHAHQHERQQNHQDHGQGHKPGRQGGPVAHRLEQASVDRPTGEAQHHRPEQRRDKRAQHQEAAGQQEQQHSPAQVLLHFSRQRRYAILFHNSSRCCTMCPSYGTG